MNLKELHSGDQLRNLSTPELEHLARQIRLFLLHSISKTGGHLSSNLGAVELTLALHVVFDIPKDKLIFDVGHQSYTHKILTGRADQFGTLRQFHGLSGFQKRKESEADPWEAGHSSTSISAGLGLATARDLLGEDYQVISVIGDGAIGSGMALEALNDLGRQKRKMIVVFNDNNMSISPNDSGLERSITRLRTSKVYRETKKDLNHSLSTSAAGQEILHLLKRSRDIVKHRVIDAPLFSQFNLDYIGPVDGHDLPALISAFQTAKEKDEPVVVHVVTTKGKGYPPAANDLTGEWHGVGPFDLYSGRPLGKPEPGVLSWSQIIARTLMRLAAQDEKLCVLTPAMATGSELIPFARRFPDRFFDPGIAEEHAITMAGAMASGGLHPFLSIYSSFLQRGYDQVLHDVARMNLPVVFGIDRAGLVGADGDTHQGIYDIAFLSTIPGLILCQPKDAKEAQDLLYTLFHTGKPSFIRYPKGSVPFSPNESFQLVPVGSWTLFSSAEKPTEKAEDAETTRKPNPASVQENGSIPDEKTAQNEWAAPSGSSNLDGSEHFHTEPAKESAEGYAIDPSLPAVIAYGPDVDVILERAKAENLAIQVVNARFFAPLDTKMMDALLESRVPLLVYETDSSKGGLSEQLRAYCGDHGRSIEVMSLQDGFIEQGSIERLKKEQGVSIDDLFERLKTYAH